MTAITFNLHHEHGEIRYEQLDQAEYVPRLGETITFDGTDSYQVLDVLWALGGHGVVVTAGKVDWHKHVAKVIGDWDTAHIDK